MVVCELRSVFRGFFSFWLLNVCMFRCICLWLHIFVSCVWIVKQEGEFDLLPWRSPLTVFILLPDICLTGTVRGAAGSWPSTGCIPPGALCCSVLMEIRFCNTFMTDWWSLWVFVHFRNAAKESLCNVLDRDPPFSLGIYSNKHLLSVAAPGKSEAPIKQRLALKNTMFGWKFCRKTNRRSIHLILECTYLHYCPWSHIKGDSNDLLVFVMELQWKKITVVHTERN